MIVSAPEAEFYIRELLPTDLEEIGSTRWLSQHEHLEKLNMQAAIQSTKMEDEFVKELFVSYEKIPVLVHNLVVNSCWKKSVYPHIVKKIEKVQISFQLYIVLHHELTLTGLLEILIYQSDCCQSVEDLLPDLVDYCHRQIIAFSHWTSDDKRFLVTESKDLENDSDLQNQAKKIQFQVGIKSISILCNIIENLTELPLGICHRLLSIHDTIMLFLQILENPPWEYLSRKEEKNFRYIGNKWVEIKAENRLKIEKYEVQVWIALLRMITDSENFRKYELNDFKKNHILKLRSRLTDVLLDQLPSLIPLRRVLEELALFNPPPAKKDLIMEQISVVYENLQQKFNGKWESIADQQLMDFFSPTPEAVQEQAKILSELYNMESLETFFDDGPKCTLCGQEATKKCPRCDNEWYCDQNCQSIHWSKHKTCCDIVAKN